jgi:hypothetical protein
MWACGLFEFNPAKIFHPQWATTGRPRVTIRGFSFALKMFEVCHYDTCDVVVVVSGDTDLSPAVVTCERVFEKKKFIFAFPFNRKNKELLKIAPDSW